jgi:hypothetical protein
MGARGIRYGILHGMKLRARSTILGIAIIVVIAVVARLLFVLHMPPVAPSPFLERSASQQSGQQTPMDTINSLPAEGTSASSTDKPIAPLSIASIAPTSGAAGSTVTLTGSGFYELSEIDITGLGQTQYDAYPDTFTGERFSSSGTITFTMPYEIPTGTYHIQVNNPQEQLRSSSPGSNVFSFTVTSPYKSADLYINSIAPSSGPSGAVIALTGSGFSQWSEVNIAGSTKTQPVYNDMFTGDNFGSSTGLTFTIPSNIDPGTYNIQVENYQGDGDSSPVSNFVSFVVTSVPPIMPATQ